MEFYEVTNGNWSLGFYLKKENAEKEVKRTNDLTQELLAQGVKNLDTKKAYIVTHQTED